MTEKVYDLAVVGGGIAGVAVARDAALRGLSVVLFEKNTLGSGASSKSSKLIHGGIRYLELAWMDFKRLRWADAFKNFRFVFSSLRETRILALTAPGLVHPIRLFVPVYRNARRKPFSVYAGTRLYGFLSALAGNPSPVKIFKNPKAVLEAMPLLSPEGLAGGVEVGDYTTNDLALVEAVAESARRNGADFFERAKILSWKKEAGEFLLEADIAGARRTFRAGALVDASGPWMDRRYVFPLGGSHIELKAFLGRSAILEARDGRVFFVIEKEGRARVGTTEWPCENPDDVRVPPADAEYLLASLSRYFPKRKWAASDILSSDAGVRPLALHRAVDNATYLSREHEIKTDAQGAFHLAGVKLTDHRRAAEKTVDRVLRALGKNGARSRTATSPLGPRPE